MLLFASRQVFRPAALLRWILLLLGRVNQLKRSTVAVIVKV
jgi:hypothetical protein